MDAIDEVDEPKKDLKSLHKKAMEDFESASTYWAENRKNAIEDMEFRAGKQWPTEVQQTRKNRPMLVVDKLNQFVRQVVNDGRMNRPSIKIRPIDDGGDVEVAEALQGIVRHICERSNADIAFDSGLEPAVVGGFGYIRVATDYTSRKSFNQDLLVMRVRNPMSILLDPSCQQADGSDAKFGFVMDKITKAEFKRRYPKAKYVSFDSQHTSYSDQRLDSDYVRVCEYFYKVEEDEEVHLLKDGTTTTDEEYQEAIEAGVQAPAILETRTLPHCEVKWCMLSGEEILEQSDWLGKYIPIVPVYGNEYDIDGKVIYSGLIRAAKDPQRLYNYSRSAYAERVALTPKSPFIAAAGQVEQYPEWEDANTENYSVLRYDPVAVDGQSVPAPQRQSASDIPEGFARDMQLSEHDIQASMGMYNASLGAQSNEKSGKAILARQREGDTGTFHYIDNLNRAIRHIGVILVDLIPKIYDSRRVIRILGEDGESQKAEHNPDQQEAVVRVDGKAIYNLNVGEYDVSITTGPSFTTKRLEAAEAMIEITRANPGAWNTHGDLIAKAQDWPGAEDWAKRSKMFLPPEVQQSLQNDNNLSPDAQAIKSQADMAIKQREQQIEEMQAQMQEMGQKLQTLEMQAKNTADQTQIEFQQAQVDMFKAETDRMKAEFEMQQTPPPPPQDNAEMEIVKLELEDKWKQLEAETKIIVAKIAADASSQNASITAEASKENIINGGLIKAQTASASKPLDNQTK